MKKGESITVNFSSKRFNQAMKLRKMSIRKLSNPDTGCGIPDSTIRRAKREQKIKPTNLDTIAKYLDVRPQFLSGQYDKECDRIGEAACDEQLAETLKEGLRPEKFPYYLSISRSDLVDTYIESILALHDISMRQYQEMTFDQQKQFALDIEYAIVPVILKHFTNDAMGRQGLPELCRLEAEIDSWDPDEPTEPDLPNDFFCG